jgi:hypothetical protein
MPYYFKYKTLFSCWRIGVHLKFQELFTSLQTVHWVAWKGPNVNIRASLSPPPPPTTPQFHFGHCMTFLSFRCVHFSVSFYPQKRILHDAKFKGCSVCWCIVQLVGIACVHYWRIIEIKLFSCVTNSLILGQGKGEIPRLITQYFKDLQNKLLAETCSVI